MDLSISVITVNTNELHRLKVLLPSLFSIKGEFEFILSDNGSTDGSIEYITSNFPQVRIHKNNKNLGFALANNVAALTSESDILVFLNPDTTVDEYWLVNLLKPFSDPKVGLTTSKILLMSAPEKINTCGNSVHISGITQCRGFQESKNKFLTTEEVPAVSGASFAIRRCIFEELGGFDKDFFIYMEETDLSIRARLRGWKCIYVPDSIVYHDYQLRFGPNKVFYQERNRYMMLLKNLKISTLIFLLPINLLAEMITWGFVILRDRKNFMNKIRAYKWVLSNWDLVMEKRKENQKARTISDKELLDLTSYRIDFRQISNDTFMKVLDYIFGGIFFIFRSATSLILKFGI